MRAGRLAAAMVVLAPGCALVMDTGSNGYRLADAGDALSVACDSDAMCTAFGVACVAAADCPSGQVCCLAATGGSASFVCQAGPACAGAVQLCKRNAECSGLTCIAQRCQFGSQALSFSACGNIPSCSPSP